MGGDMALYNKDEAIKKFSNGEIQILNFYDLIYLYCLLIKIF